MAKEEGPVFLVGRILQSLTVEWIPIRSASQRLRQVALEDSNVGGRDAECRIGLREQRCFDFALVVAAEPALRWRLCSHRNPRRERAGIAFRPHKIPWA